LNQGNFPMFFTLYFLQVTNSSIYLPKKKITPNTNLAGLARSTLAFDKDDFVHRGQPNRIPPTQG
jgi:hypothetical protein